MLSEKKVPKTFWPEALNWAIHVLNWSLTLAVKDVTPEEAWSGNIPYVDYFRVFGCIAYVHTPDARRTKLDYKSVKCVLLGVTEELKAYRLYNPISKKIMISRDMVFAENEAWNWNSSSDEKNNDILEWGDMEEEENEEDQVVEEDVNEEVEEEAVNSPSSESNEEEIVSPVQGRNKREPVWWQDYVSGEGLSKDDEEQNFVMFTTSADPVTFKEAVRSSK